MDLPPQEEHSSWDFPDLGSIWKWEEMEVKGSSAPPRATPPHPVSQDSEHSDQMLWPELGSTSGVRAKSGPLRSAGSSL